MHKRIIYGAVAFGLMALAAVSVLSNMSAAAKRLAPITGEALHANDRVKIEGDLAALNEAGVLYATGTMRNISGGMLKYVEVGLALYDASGAQVGATKDVIGDLAPGALWRFKAPVLGEGVTRAEIVKIEAW